MHEPTFGHQPDGTRVERGPGWELRLGKFQDVLADIERCDAVITDPPYLSACADGGAGNPFGGGDSSYRPRGNVMGYEPASEALLDDVATFAARVCAGWFVAFNDFDGAHYIRTSIKQRGAVSAEPIAWVKPPALTPPRGANNLPEKGTEFIVASRFRPLSRAGCIPGSYVSPNSTPRPGVSLFVTGGKPIDLMRAIVRDFTRPGDLIVEPFSGGGTTLLAAVMEGRRAIGAEMDAGRFEIAVKRLRKGYTTSLFAEHEAEMKQEVLF